MSGRVRGRRWARGCGAACLAAAGFVLGAWVGPKGTAAGRASGEPSDEVVWNALHLETEACRRRLRGGGAVFSGPVRELERAAEAEGRVRVAYEVPLWMGEGVEGGLVPLRGEVLLVREADGWAAHERHLNHWRAAGLLPEGR